MKELKYETEGTIETKELAGEILKELKKVDGNVILLEGNLGAGKTTFSQGLLEYLGAEEPFTSPTFVIMKDYEVNKEGFKKVYHLDCYRIDEEGLVELGWEEFIADKKNLVIVEWPERIKSAWPKEKFLHLRFDDLYNGKRRIEVVKN
jgi:tRNA threonylcarbamoyladenosine biosynthesis protein TsaE